MKRLKTFSGNSMHDIQEEYENFFLNKNASNISISHSAMVHPYKGDKMIYTLFVSYEVCNP